MFRAFALPILLALSLASPRANAEESADAAPDIARRLLEVAQTQAACSKERRAAEATAQRLGDLPFPTEGRFLMVNLASRTLSAYRDGREEFSMRVVIGKTTAQTPIVSTVLDSVRYNPTWTVPEGIVSKAGWRDRLTSNPDFFIRNAFDLVDHSGRVRSVNEAANDPSSIARFVQRSGAANALGYYRFNLRDTDAIYLHDTSERWAFRGPWRLASHGCVRVEHPEDLATWVLERPTEEIRQAVKTGRTMNVPVATPIPVVLGYFTAWPNPDGGVRYHEDVYGLDAVPGCPKPRPAKERDGDDEATALARRPAWAGGVRRVAVPPAPVTTSAADTPAPAPAPATPTPATPTP